MTTLTDLSQINLPTNKTEEYRFTPIARVLEKAFPKGFFEESGARSQKPGDLDLNAYLIPGLDCSIISIVDGVYAGQSGANPSNDVFDQLNASLSKGVLTIGASEKPVLILNINTGSTNVHNRFSIKVDKGASISVIERSINLSASPLFQTLSEEIEIDENGRLDLYKIQDTANIIEVCNTSIVQKNNSHVNTFTLLTNGILVRNNLSISIDGEKCESHFHGLSLLNGETIGDHHTVVDHRMPNSFSNELYKGVMDNKSKGVFNGKIYVRPHAQKTNAFQSNRNILLTDQATINTKPQLEIWADDVKCSHGCTTGQLDDEALFYLQSRGIRKDDAKAMLLYAFAMQTTELIALEPLKTYIEKLISTRLYAQ